MAICPYPFNKYNHFMNKLHLEILAGMRKLAPKKTARRDKFKNFTLSYLGSPRPSYNLSITVAIKIASEFVKKHKDLSFNEYLELLDSLYTGRSFNERTFGRFLLLRYPKLRTRIPPQKLDQWLNGLAGWCEVDSLCQNLFKFDEMGKNWSTWEKLLRNFNKDENVSKRRASLVLLTGPARATADDRVAKLAFKNIDTLKSEKDILITKAISWLLRHLIKHHKAEVAEYLKKNENTLPRIAVREVKNKLLTGKKHAHKKTVI